MRVIRGRSYQSEDGRWEKLEIELNDDDLLPAEKAARDHLKPLLLEIRAEQQLIAFLRRAGQVTREEADAQSDALRKQRESLLAKREPKPGRLVT